MNLSTSSTATTSVETEDEMSTNPRQSPARDGSARNDAPGTSARMRARLDTSTPDTFSPACLSELSSVSIMPLRRHQEHFLPWLPFGIGLAAEYLEVEHCILNGDGYVVLGLELDSADQLGLGHVGHIDVAHDDFLVAHANLSRAAPQAVAVHKGLEFPAEEVGVDDLSVDDETIRAREPRRSGAASSGSRFLPAGWQ